MSEEEKEIENQARRNRQGGVGGGWVGCSTPRFWLKLTFNKMTITVKRKKEPKNINHIKFLKNY